MIGLCDGERSRRPKAKLMRVILEGSSMWKRAKRMCRDESGAVTVDWVILTSAVVGLAVVAYVGIQDTAIVLQTSTAQKVSQAGQ